MSILEAKKSLRKEISKKKKLVPKDEQYNRSSLVMQELELSLEFLTSKIILAYWPMQDEVQTHEFIEKWKDSKTILLPQIDGDNLKARIYEGKSSLKKNASFNVYEPTGKVFSNLSKIDLVMVPGIAFDKKNNRLGRGKGFYDRFLAKCKKATKVGIGFDFQLVSNVPAEKSDVPVDMVVTD